MSLFCQTSNNLEHFSPESTKKAVEQPRKRYYLVNNKVCLDCEIIKSYLNDASLRPLRDAMEEYKARSAEEFSIKEIDY